jgi:predicted nucleic acid-binding protein
MPSGRTIAIVDAGPLYASVDEDDLDHARSIAVLRRSDLDLVVPALVLAEVSYLVEKRLGSQIEAAFLRGLAALEVEPPAPRDWPAIADMVARYADLRLGTVDASVAVLADRLDTDLIVTLDTRHFGVIRSPRGRAFELLPEPWHAAHEDGSAYESAARDEGSAGAG